MRQVTVGTVIYSTKSTFISPMFTFSWRETHLFTHQVNVQSSEKYCNNKIQKAEFPTPAGNKHFPSKLFLHSPRLFHHSTELYGLNQSKMDIKLTNPGPAKNKILRTTHRRLSIIGKDKNGAQNKYSRRSETLPTDYHGFPVLNKGENMCCLISKMW